MPKFNIEKIKGGYIDEGREKKVYGHHERKDLVVSEFHKQKWLEETPEQIKARFYLTKILHLLYPQNIPNIHLAASEPHALIIDRVKGSTMASLMDEAEKIDDFYQELDSLGVYLDFKHWNFLKTKKDGGEEDLMYVDTFDAYKILRDENGKPVRIDRWYLPDALKEAIVTNLSGDKRERALKYLERLLALEAEERKKLNKS